MDKENIFISSYMYEYMCEFCYERYILLTVLWHFHIWGLFSSSGSGFMKIEETGLKPKRKYLKDQSPLFYTASFMQAFQKTLQQMQNS